MDIKSLINKVIASKGILRVPSWWMKKVLMQMADWVQEGYDANSKKIEKVRSEADKKISTIETDTNSKINTIKTNISTLKTDVSTLKTDVSTLKTDVSTLKTDVSTTDNILSDIIESVKFQHSLKMFTIKGWGYVFVDGVKQIIPSGTKKIISFVNTFSFKGYLQNTSLIYNYTPYIGFNATDTSKITNMREMFFLCSKLTSLDLSDWNTSNVEDMSFMFNGCSKLTSLDLSSFDTSVVKDMRSMFEDCRELTSLDLSGFDTSKVTDMRDIFYRCQNLTSLILGSNFFKTSAVTSIDFSDCSKWTNDTVVTSLVTNSYDRASASLNTLTLKLHANTKAVLSDEQKAAITSKGYTIA